MKEKVIALMEMHPEIFLDAFLKRFPTDEELANAEKSLELTIPNEYVWFLKTYGHGGFCFEFLGFGVNGKALFVEKTLHERTFGLPRTLIVIESMDEYVNCIDTLSNKIVSWSKHDSDGVINTADNFYAYFFDRVKTAIENY